MIETTWDRIAALRLERQHLGRRAAREDLIAVVRDHVGIQAQVMGNAELALNARIDGLTRDDVRDALWAQRTLVKTWAMRGTLHLVAAEELPERPEPFAQNPLPSVRCEVVVHSALARGRRPARCTECPTPDSPRRHRGAGRPSGRSSAAPSRCARSRCWASPSSLLRCFMQMARPRSW